MFNNKDIDYSVEARFGRIITENKWGVVPFSIYLHQKELGLKIHDVWFLIWLIIHKWTEENPYPSIAKMSRITGISESYIRKISSDLQKKGIIRVEPRFREGGGQNSNMYDLEPLFEMIRGMIGNENSQEEQKTQVHEENQPEQLAVEYHPDDFSDDFRKEVARLDKLEESNNMQQAIDKTRENFTAKFEKNKKANKELIALEE